jgi:hypothetical protein
MTYLVIFNFYGSGIDSIQVVNADSEKKAREVAYLNLNWSGSFEQAEPFLDVFNYNKLNNGWFYGASAGELL